MYKNETLNIVMPVYNEEKTVYDVIKRVLAQKEVDRLIIVDDSSKDNSYSILKAAAKKNKKISLFQNKKNMGKGGAVAKGIADVKDGIIIIQDADEEYFPEDYPKLLPKLGKNNVVFGTRMRGRKTGHTYELAKLANKSITFIFDLLYGEKITDINTCYKVFRKSMLDGIILKEKGFLLEPELAIKLIKKGYKIVEVDIRYEGRAYDEGKKIKAKDGIDQISYIIKERFTNQ